MRVAVVVGLGLWAVVLVYLGPTPGTRADEPSVVVNCLDVERQTVSKTVRGRCDGRIVDDAEAARIKKQRSNYKQRAVAKSQQPGGPTRGAQPGPGLPGDRGQDTTRPRGIGSAFFVSGSGHLLTNSHVVRDCTRITVSPATGGSSTAEVVARNDRHDLALLKAAIRPRAVARFASSTRPPEDLIVGIVGYPALGLPTIRPQLTTGRVAGTYRIDDRFTAIRLEADVRSGNSGGPVLDPQGNVIGVVFAKVNTVAVYGKTGELVREVGYAVPNGLAKGFLGRHNVGFRGGAAAGPDADLLNVATSFVARIKCF